MNLPCTPGISTSLRYTPDLIVEVIAPKTTRRDEVVQFDLYRTESVPHYVLVYPEAKKAHYHQKDRA
jgi:Uma2 family endonuclease